MLRKTLGYIAFLLLLFLGNSSGVFAPQALAVSSDGQSGTLEKMAVSTGTVTMDLDLNRLNGIASDPPGVKRDMLRFQVSPNSFFTVLVFNNMLRGPDAGSIGLIPGNTANLPAALQTSLGQLAIDKLASDASFELALRDTKTGFVFFNIDRNQYDYDSAAHLFTVNGGRLLISTEFANKLGRPSDAGANVGEITISATTYPSAGASGDDFRTTVQPANRAGATL